MTLFVLLTRFHLFISMINYVVVLKLVFHELL